MVVGVVVVVVGQALLGNGSGTGTPAGTPARCAVAGDWQRDWQRDRHSRSALRCWQEVTVVWWQRDSGDSGTGTHVGQW